jgi:chemotaxis protein CheC
MNATVEDMRTLTPRQMDALREVANIGAGHAATALSQMIGSTVMISVPRIQVSKLSEMPPVVDAPEEPVAAVLLHMLGDLTGRTLLVFPHDVAMRLSELMLQRPEGSCRTFGTMEQSCINEAGNILSSAYLNALSAFMGIMLLPSPPIFAVDVSTTVLTTTHLQLQPDQDQIFCIESEFMVKDTAERLRGFFLLLPDPASLGAILRAVRAS